MALNPKVPIQSTAGAIPLKNQKGELYMEKVKVSRYVSGKRPDYAPESSDEDEEDLEFGFCKQKQVMSNSTVQMAPVSAPEMEDRRLRRLQERAAKSDDDEEDEEDREERMARRRRRVQEPEVLARVSDEEDAGVGAMEDDDDDEEEEGEVGEMGDGEGGEDYEEELDEDEIERRRANLRAKALLRAQQQHEEVMEVEEEKEGSAAESSEYESEWESEEEDTGPRLKPIFVRKKDRITIQEKEREAQKQKELEAEAKRAAEERRKTTLKMVENEVKRELEERKKEDGQGLEAVDTDDENDEEEYEAWKVRELKRIKRDREEREQLEKERQELDMVHNMTEEERRKWAKENPKETINQAKKGKYRFLQKYYHRGVFFLDEEEDVFKRDFAAPTLEDHFDKTVLPKVMQVKNFGRSGRTKYTHLVDQDTTNFESPWVSDTAMNLKFHTARGGGMKQTFDRPSTKKK